MSFNKWIGGGLGWAFGGPIGGLVGFALGALFDGMSTQAPTAQHAGRSPHATTGGDLALSLVVLSAAVMKADGKVTKAELDVVKRFFRQQFGEEQAQQLLLVMRDVLKREIPVHQVCIQVRQYMPHPARLQLMHYLIGLAHADGRVDRSELDMLRRIAAGLGVNEKDLGSMSAMFGRGDIESAYRILEVDPKASDDAVKKAYRRMAVKHHPDKVGHLGDEVQKAAADKFKKVQQAWERIRRERGIN
ncbi:MAG: TerB family tellurite resistance protein [Flavobacteriales bacterium]|nr:TerB family tellurite resistance protein [Flavobacteriales bacterium]MCB9168075.1 TerB family tellurite resistance protein [Flavobacteriales bacterium]